MDKMLRELAAKIRRYRHAVVGVFEDRARGEPGFSYTVGLSKGGQLPELLIFGIDPGSARSLLNDLVEGMRKMGRPACGARVEKVANMPRIM